MRRKLTRPICKIGKRDVIGYKNAWLELPSHCVKRFPGMILPDAIAANEKRKEPFPLLETRAVNDKWLSSWPSHQPPARAQMGIGPCL